MIQEVKKRVDESLKELVTKRIAEELESRVRRCDPALNTFDALLHEAEVLLSRIIQDYSNSSTPADRLEAIFRSLLMQRLPKYLEAVHSAHCKTPVTTSMSLMQHKVKLAEEDVTRYR